MTLAAEWNVKTLTLMLLQPAVCDKFLVRAKYLASVKGVKVLELQSILGHFIDLFG